MELNERPQEALVHRWSCHPNREDARIVGDAASCNIARDEKQA